MNTKEITRTAILTAIIYLSMALLHVNIFGSALHLGSMMIVIVSLSFPRKEALIASSIAPTLFDLTSGYVAYAPFTFIARLLLSLIVSFAKNKELRVQIIAAIVGGVVVIIVYFISYLVFSEGLKASLAASVPDVIQLLLAVVGVFISVPIRKITKKL